MPSMSRIRTLMLLTVNRTQVIRIALPPTSSMVPIEDSMACGRLHGLLTTLGVEGGVDGSNLCLDA